jgi:hypothetical protein
LSGDANHVREVGMRKGSRNQEASALVDAVKARQVRSVGDRVPSI